MTAELVVQRYPRARRPLAATVGAIEAAAPMPDGRGWLLLGWTPVRWAEREHPDRLHATLSLGAVTGEVTSVFFDRADVPDGAGFCAVLHGAIPPQATLQSIEVPALGVSLPLLARAAPLTALNIATEARLLIRRAHGVDDIPLLALLPRPGFDGRDTIASLWPPVHLELDRSVWIRPDGIALTGWLVDAGDSVVTLSVCCGANRVALDRAAWIAIRRPDIFKQFSATYGLDDDELGFLAYAPDVGAGTAHLEIETASGEIAHKPLRILDAARIGAMKQVLSAPRPSAARLQAAFDTVLGPVVEGLNTQRAASPPSFGERVFGPIAAPRTSVVVPLHGRIDFMEWQQALFCEQPGEAVELIYVLDDPTLAEEADRLAFSCWARFQLPFRLLTLSRNVGYAAANNVGIEAARGTWVCLLNSDVFPLPGDGLAWVDRLARRLQHDRTLGAVGPLLLFENDTIQHDGMHYERRPALANWAFPIHTNKGHPAPTGGGLTPVHAITAACMVVDRARLRAMGGFDQGYVIGDFEDADLCERLRTAGLGCAVDHGVRLYHLERQSQGDGQPWRANATLYNAWRFNRRWGGQVGAGR